MEKPPIHLTVLRKGDSLIIDLDEVGALIPRSETQVESPFLQELTATVLRLVSPGYGRGRASASSENLSSQQTSSILRDLQQVGGVIFSHLLTDPARHRLRTAEAVDVYLRLDEQLMPIPWELCFDGEQFLATKFSVGRQVITGAPIPPSITRHRQSGILKILLIVDPTETLPEANTEAQLLCTLLDGIPRVEVTLLGGKQIQKVPLLAELQEYDLVHFAGHSFYDPQTPSKSGWRLHDSILTAGELSKCRQPPQVVFSNSCQAGASAEWNGTNGYEGQTFGIGSAFLLAGVKNYIGTFWEVDDEESRLFALAFYQNLVTGMSLGAALLAARQTIIQHKGWNSLTWASYVLYGDPAFTLWSPQTAKSQSTTVGIDSPSVPPVAPEQNNDSVGSGRTASSLSLPLKENHFSTRFWFIGLGVLFITTSLAFFAPKFLDVRQHQISGPMQNSSALSRPNKPSLVVLPFLNLSHDPEQEYFSDGISEDLMTDLSKLSSLFVIARNSAFSYKGKTTKPEQIGKELGVRYVLAGSVRKADNRVRITAQLVDTTTNSSLWAERYDRLWQDIFALQDEITGKIVAALQVQIAPEEQKRLKRIPTNNLEAYDFFLRGWSLYGQMTEETTLQARQLFEQAIRLDPQYADAYAALAVTYLLEWTWQWQQTPQTLEQALTLAQHATSLNDTLASAQMVLGNVFLWKKEYDRAIAATEKAITLDPNDAEGYATLGEIFTWIGKPDEAIEWIQKAIRLNPRASTSYLWVLGHAHRLAGRCEAAMAVQREVLLESVIHIGAHVELVVCASELGHAGEARAEAAEIRQINPQISLESLRRSLPYKDDALREHVLTQLSKAGLH